MGGKLNYVCMSLTEYHVCISLKGSSQSHHFVAISSENNYFFVNVW